MHVVASIVKLKIWETAVVDSNKMQVSSNTIMAISKKRRLAGEGFDIRREAFQRPGGQSCVWEGPGVT